MSGIRVNSFVNQAAPSIAPDIKKDGEKNTSNWKAYVAAGTAIAGIAFAAGRSWSANSMNSDVIDIKDLSQQVYSVFASNSLKPELQETVGKVRDIVVDVLADKEISNDDIITTVMAFAKEIDPILTKFPDAAPKEIALLSASEAIWVGAGLKAGLTNEIIEKVFENSCKEWNLNYNELMQTLSNSFDNSTIDEDARSFIDYNREYPCQFPYCQNWIPPLPESLSGELLQKAKSVQSIILELFDKNNIKHEARTDALSIFAQEIELMSTRFPDASSLEIALLSASEAIWKGADLKAGPSNEIIEKVFENSCKELNHNYNELMQTLSNRLNNSTINEDARSFIDYSRENLCQFPYCQNWIPPLPESLQPELLEKAKSVRSIILDLFDKNNIKHEDRANALSSFAKEIELMSTRFPDANSLEIALLAASEGIWATTLSTDQSNDIIENVFKSSCRASNMELDQFLGTLSRKFNNPVSDTARDFIDNNRKGTCQYPYCVNFTPSETGDSANAIPGKETRAPGLTVTECGDDDCKEDV